MNRQLGFNIIELMVAVVVLGILLGIGVPGMQSLIQNNRLTSQINSLSTALALARSEAIKRNQRVVVCVSTDGQSCEAAGSGTGWDDGWIVFVDRSSPPNHVVDLGAPGTDDCADTAVTDCILSVQAAFPGTNTLTPAAADVEDLIVYVGDGSARCKTGASVTDVGLCTNANAYFTLCDFRGAAHAKALSISRTGRVASISKTPDGSALACP